MTRCSISIASSIPVDDRVQGCRRILYNDVSTYLIMPDVANRPALKAIYRASSSISCHRAGCPG